MPLWAAELAVVYPRIYDKRTTYYDSLAKQIKSDVGLNVSVAEPKDAVTADRVVVLGGTELFLHGFQSKPALLSAQLGELKVQFPEIVELNLLYSDIDNAGLAQVSEQAGQLQLQLKKQQGSDGQGVAIKFSSLLKNSGKAAKAFWLPGALVSTTGGSPFMQILEMAWDKQLAVISAAAPRDGQDFVFTLLTNNQSFSNRLSTALGKAGKDMFVMVPPKKPQTLTVIYPKVKAPHDLVFNQIIDGIEQQFDGSVNLVPISKKDDRAAVAATIDRDRPDMVITLSKTGKDVAKRLKVKTPWVAGAAQLRPNDISGISPGGAPNLILSYLNELAPEIKRVHVVHSPGSQWLIDLAELAAGKIGLQLVKHPVKNRKEAIIKYTDLFKQSNYKTDAFWLPYDNVTSSNKYILPLVLDASWDKRFVVISSIPPHAKRGALLSLYPDNMTTGVELVKMVERMFVESTKGTVVPTSQVLLAVNLRTASHLGLEYTTKQKGQFHLTFPSR